MTRHLYIVLFALGLAGCASQQPPLDDAYYYPDKKAVAAPATETAQTAEAKPTAQTATASQTAQIQQASPSMEFINVQDTTVTVRIKR